MKDLGGTCDLCYGILEKGKKEIQKIDNVTYAIKMMKNKLIVFKNRENINRLELVFRKDIIYEILMLL